MEEDEGMSIQSAMYSWFLKREKRESLKVRVLDPITANAKLKRMGVTQTNFADYTPDELANILEVDAIIMGTFETNKPMSEGGCIFWYLNHDFFSRHVFIHLINIFIGQ
jgi:hypothetical protein